MGFRDLHVFNLAMLAKQAWRLFYHANSLFYRIYEQDIFLTNPFWRLKLETTRHMYGTACWQQGM